MPEGDWTPGEQQSDHAKTMVVSGCNHAAVADHLQGRFHKAGMNHGKPVYKKEEVASGSEVHAYFWDGRDGPDLCGWWFRAKVGGDTVWAYNANKASESPPWWGWQVPHHGPVDPSIVIEFGEDKRTQQEWAQQQQMPQTPKSIDQHWGGQQQEVEPEWAGDYQSEEFVEWRRSLPWDEVTGWPADSTTFLRLCAQLGLYVPGSVVKLDGDKCELKLNRTQFGGALTFYAGKRGKITIGQSDRCKKAAIWRLLEPWTHECQERPAKRKKITQTSTQGCKIPSPAELLANSC